FLCYEGFEKLAHKLLHSRAGDEARHAKVVEALSDPAVDLVALEKDKIRGAVRTDFILSAEIIVITLGTVATVALATRVAVLVGIALIMTVGVYGLVAGIVKLDDAGLYLARQRGADAWARIKRGTGAAIVSAAPWMMKGLAVAGTAAMFLVGGGILTHGIPGLHGWIDAVTHAAGGGMRPGGVLDVATLLLIDAAVGIVAGGIAAAAVGLFERVTRLVKGG
ncbi:MAG: DUF808 family protein, partial [Burkholderiales bacterium]